MDGDYDDPGPQNTLSPSESLDSDDVRNDDGVVVDAPTCGSPSSNTKASPSDSPRNNLNYPMRPNAESPRRSRRHYGQIGGTPEDGESFYPVHHDDADDSDED